MGERGVTKLRISIWTRIITALLNKNLNNKPCNTRVCSHKTLQMRKKVVK